MDIYVGNVAFTVSEDEIKNLFAEKGSVSAVKLIKDKFTGKSKGFAFVTMDDSTEAQRAIDELNGHELGGRALRVNEARGPQERQDRPRSSGFGGGSRDRGGFGGERRSSNGGGNSWGNRGGGSSRY